MKTRIKGYIDKQWELVLFLYYRVFVFRWIKRKFLNLDKPRIFFGLTPIINNKYWANSLKDAGYIAKSMSAGVPLINSKNDFDILLDELFPVKDEETKTKLITRKLKLFAYILENFDILVMSFKFNIFSDTAFWKYEALLLEKAGLKTVIIPFGSDYYMYSKVIDHCLRHNLMVNVPDEMFAEEKIFERVTYWKNKADFIMMGQMIDGSSRWDCLPVNCLCIDTEQWKRTKTLSLADGTNDTVKIVHTPNHRGFKGTEFIIKAVKELQQEGLKVELILIEKMQNSEVRRILLEEADILVEQIIFTGYALSGIEGMTAGIPVVSNLQRNDITQLFRRYSYLNECPIYSTTPETICDDLRVLIKNPQLRQQLGKAGREYAVKYHSLTAFSKVFDQIVDKIWFRKEGNLMHFYNPQNPSSYNNSMPVVSHPLINNQFQVQD